MTDFVALSLTADTSKLERNLQSAGRGLDELGTKAQTAQKKLDGVGAGGGSGTGRISLPGQDALRERINALALATQQLSGGGGAGGKAFSVVGDIASSVLGFNLLKQSLVGITGASGVAKTALTGVLTAVRANPWGIALTALSAVAIGMNVFGDNTKKTTKDIKEQISELQKLRDSLPDARLRERITGKSPRSSPSAAADAIAALFKESSVTGTRSLGAKELADLFGVSEVEFRTALAKSGLGESALERRPTYRRQYREGQTGTRPELFVQTGYEYINNNFSKEQGIKAGQTIYDDRTSGEKLRLSDAEQRAAQEKRILELNENDEKTRLKKSADERKQGIEESKKAMEELNERARTFGNTIGSAFIDAATGAAKVGDIVRGFGLDFARQLASNSFAELYKLGVNAVGSPTANKTPTQSSSNIQLPPREG